MWVKERRFIEFQSDFYGNFTTAALAFAWKVININKASLDNGHFRGINKHDTGNGSFEFFIGFLRVDRLA
jgi:hypothetical protein